jgi:hypothetical protein
MGSSDQESLSVSPVNTTFVVGGNRISIALLDSQRNPVHASDVAARVRSPAGRLLSSITLHDIAPEYGDIPVYVGVATFRDAGQYELLVTARGDRGRALTGHAFITVSVKTPNIALGEHVPLVHQPVLGDAGVTLAAIDSGVPPDNWHTATIADGVAQHRPMVLYFGDPAYCPSKTCGPTHQIVEELCARYCSQMLFEHIETYYPAGPPGANAHVNPAFTAFGLQTDPWVYFVNAEGVVADAYEGPVTLVELEQSAVGTLAGRVPAVSLS